MVVVVVFATLADIACGCDHIAVHLDQVEERWWIDPDCLIQWWQGRIDPHKDIWQESKDLSDAGHIKHIMLSGTVNHRAMGMQGSSDGWQFGGR